MHIRKGKNHIFDAQVPDLFGVRRTLTCTSDIVQAHKLKQKGNKMFWKKNIKLIHARIDFIVEQSKNMAKQIDKLSQALENTVYPGMNEEREAIQNNMNAINKIIAKIYKKKGTK